MDQESSRENSSANIWGRLNPNAAEFVPSRDRFENGRSRRRPIHGSDVVRRYDGSSDNLRTTLSGQLRNETYECMICCDKIRWTHPVWSCTLCYCIFHLRCAKKWAKSCSDGQENNRPSAPSSEWRCPGCQSANQNVPNEYKCFCGSMKNPYAQNRHLVPHTCGELCQKRRVAAGDDACPHPCTEPCHPGPCDPCPLTMNKRCLCGKEARRLRCGSEAFQCGQSCDKLLNCGVHRCQRVCHAGACAPCCEKLSQECYCGRSQREMICGAVASSHYSCGVVCDKLLACGIHSCTKACHEGECGECIFEPSALKTCCCGKLTVEELKLTRNSCADPLPVCGNVCGKTLRCGEEGNKHVCKSLCHAGSCPICPMETRMHCRCGATTKTIPCRELEKYDGDHPLLCSRRCTKKRSCKQHRCGEVCCVDTDHLCMLICGKKLSCGIHTCEALCHSGKCRSCLQASFEELTCLCGASVTYPPVPCGTKPPACEQLCTRQHNCQHPVTHNCHSDVSCPPCTFLTEKLCYGKHETRKNIPCYLNDVSCGRACGEPLPCGQHSCIRICHPGSCVVDGEQCSQPCACPRAGCGHPCGARCHGDAPCPEATFCKHMVTVTCQCGHRVSNLPCSEIDRLASCRAMAKIAKADAQNAMNVEELSRQDSADRYKCLDCTEECARIERNRRFVEALNIDTDDVVGELGPQSYTDFLKEQYKLHTNVVLGIEKAFFELVTNAEKSKQASRSHVFPPMNRNHRRIIHEYAVHWEIDTVAYDQEPQRNVVATARKGKSKIPAMLLSAVVQKESAKTPLRVAPPIGNQKKIVSSNAGTSKMQTLQLDANFVSRR